MKENNKSDLWLDLIIECQKRGKDIDYVSEEQILELEEEGYNSRDIFHFLFE